MVWWRQAKAPRAAAQSQVIIAATQGLLQLASRVPLVNHVASLLMDLGKLYQVRHRAGAGATVVQLLQQRWQSLPAALLALPLAHCRLRLQWVPA